MAVPLVGKIAIVVLTLGVIAGLTTVIVLTVNSGDSVEDDCCVVEELEPIYEVGVGIADMTGPPVEINFMGYAEFTQSGTGLHLRQFSRAFIFVEGDKRIVYVSAEVQAVGIAVRREVVKRLQEKYGDMYRLDNVIIAGTHTHSAPGGHLVYILLDISILGFSEESFDAYVDGITRSIERAHENIVPARLFYGRTNVTDASINRSPFSYMANPPAERARYDHNTDKVLTQVRIETVNGTLHGVLNWFSVHTTSMNMSNTLISSDNLGYSALRMEQELNPGSSPGKAKVVAGFFASNLGDVSPNTYGARCEFSGIECDNQFVVCGAGERCFAPGPGDDMFESVKIIGTKIYDGAMEILNSPGVELRGKLKVVHQFVDMTVQEVPRYNPVTRSFESNETVPGCAPALGYSFVAGTQDGANTLNVTQGTLHPVEGNPVLGIINIISNPTDWDRECHAPKPILLATGRSDDPLPWHPNIISASLIWLGDLAILGVPGEPTTMAGRRMMDVVGRVMQENGIDPKVVVTGLTNDYIHYVSTFEEYQIQRYEAASTIYGPHTLDIFLNKFHEYAEIAIKDGAAENTSEPEDYRSRITTFIPPAVVDNPEANSVFGQTLYQPENEAPRGATIEAVFVAANPRNDLRHESSYFVIERLNGTDWIEVANDADFNTMFIWQRMLQDTSRVQIQWTIPEDAILGVPHKIRYFGAAKTASGDFQPFIGESNTFTIMSSPKPITKKVINSPETCVDDNLRGLIAAFPKLQLHPKHRVITVRNESDTGRVAILGGGGSGHEPFAAGFVANGMLDGAVAGGVFASPPTGHVLYAIAQLYKYNSGGVLVLIGNYTGDRLNFGKAIEKAKISGIKVESLIVGEDVASSENKTGGRGMIAEVLCYKICGALSQRHYDLTTIHNVVSEAVKYMATLGVCLSACSLPGQPPLFHIENDEIELGAGVHGEAGITKMKMGTAKELVSLILDKIVNHLKLAPGDRVVACINNLGGTSIFEMNIISAEIKDYFDSKNMVLERIYSGHIKSSLEMHGFQICLLHLNEENGDYWLELFDAPTDSGAWSVGPLSVRSDDPHVDDYSLLTTHGRKTATGPALSPNHQEVFRASLSAAAEDLIKNEGLLNKLDSGCGDGDCGTTFKNFGQAIQKYLTTASMEYPSDVLWDLSDIAETDMGGTSGGIYSLGLAAASQTMSSAKTSDAEAWQQAWQAAIQAISKYGGADPGDRTMLDTLHAGAEAFKGSLNENLDTLLRDTGAAVETGTQATAKMVAKAGRASYVSSNYTKGEDAGARAAATWLQAIFDSILNTI